MSHGRAVALNRWPAWNHKHETMPPFAGPPVFSDRAKKAGSTSASIASLKPLDTLSPALKPRLRPLLAFDPELLPKLLELVVPPRPSDENELPKLLPEFVPSPMLSPPERPEDSLSLKLARLWMTRPIVSDAKRFVSGQELLQKIFVPNCARRASA